MNTRDFNVFITAAKEKSLTNASKLLYMTPQGISKIIKNMETETESLKMNTRDFNVFITAAKEKSLTNASKLLYMTPQGISKIIKNMETETDCELFHRIGNRMELTECGQHFLTYAENASKEYHAMRNELLRIKQKEHGIVDLLSAFGILRLVTPECISDFRKKYPEIEFHYRNQTKRTWNCRSSICFWYITPCNSRMYL